MYRACQHIYIYKDFWASPKYYPCSIKNWVTPIKIIHLITIECTNFVVNPSLFSVPRTSWIWYTMPCVTFDFSKHPVHNIFDMPSWEIRNVKIVWLMIRCIILQLTFYFLLALLFPSLTILIAPIGFRGVFSNFYHIKVDVDTYAYEIHSSQCRSCTIFIVQI